MPNTCASDRPGQVPLAVDLDGTLIRSDLMMESLVRLLRRNPLALIAVLFWWARGRAFLKQQLAARVRIDPASLEYHPQFLDWLRQQKQSGRRLVLATASDRRMVQPVFDYIGLFDELLASDGRTNLRGNAKLKALAERFGERGFDYAGNSSVDLAVWKGSREAIVVNARPSLAKRAARLARLGPTFAEGYSPRFRLKRIWQALFIESRYLHATLAGLLLASAFPNVGFAGAAWVAPAMILACAHGRGGGDAFRIGYVAGLSTWLALLYWLLLIPAPGFPILGWLAMSGFLALYTATWVWLMAGRLGPGGWLRRTAWVWAGSAAWVGLELIRARLLSGFPWNNLGTSQYQLLPLIQLASITGVYGISFLVAWTSLALYSAVLAIFRHPTRRYVWLSEIAFPLLALLGVIGFGMARVRHAPIENETLRVTFVQPSIPQTMIWNTAENSNRFSQLMQLTMNALAAATANSPAGGSPATEFSPVNAATGQRSTELLLWPEAALPEFSEATFSAVTNLIASNRVWMIFGADDIEERSQPLGDALYDYYNAAFLFGPDGQYVAHYRKRQLVMFGEYVPLVRWLPFVKWFTPITGGFTSGERVVPFHITCQVSSPRNPASNGPPQAAQAGDSRRIKTAALICFEDTFPHLVREYVDADTDFLVNLTNDGWFGESAAQWQHAVTAAFRSVENGVPLLRACNNGLTCWVDSRGRIREILRDPSGSEYGAGHMTVSIPVPPRAASHPPTFYRRHGDWFGWSCVAIALLTALFAWRTRLKVATPGGGHGGT